MSNFSFPGAWESRSHVCDRTGTVASVAAAEAAGEGSQPPEKTVSPDGTETGGRLWSCHRAAVTQSAARPALARSHVLEYMVRLAEKVGAASG